jgi:hypothetical protein
MRHGRMLLVFVCAVLLGGCATYSNYQTAQVLDKGEKQFGLGLSYLDQKSEQGAEIVYESEKVVIPEFIFRAGLSERFDFGIKLYTAAFVLGAVVDGKYQFLDGETFDSAINFGVGVAGLEHGGAAFLDFPAGLLMTVNFSEAFSATLVPKVILRRVSADAGSDTGLVYGGTLTLAFGKKSKILPEIGYFEGDDILGQKASFLQYGVGVLF